MKITLTTLNNNMSRFEALDDSLNLLNKLNDEIQTSELNSNNISSYSSKKVIIILLKSLFHIIYLMKTYHKNKSSLDDTLKRKIKLKIHAILRLSNLMKSLFRHQILYDDWIFHHNFKTYFPDVYESIRRKNIDPMLAYKWCIEKPETNEDRQFMNKLLSVVTADAYYQWNEKTTTNADSAFVKEIVRIISRYQSTSTIVRALHQKTNVYMKQSQEASEKYKILDNYVKQLNNTGSIAELSYITEISSSVKTSVLPLTSVDGTGINGRIFIDGNFSNKFVVVNPGKNYAVNEIVKVTTATGPTMSIFKEYYFKIKEIFQDKKDEYMSTVYLNKLTALIPQWTRIYRLLYPGKFNFNILLNLKEDLQKYGLQYVLIKHGHEQNDVSQKYDNIVSNIQ